MKPKERQAYILEKVRQERFLSTNDLASLFNVSVQSVRKDANVLYAKGLVRRVHGGLEIVSKEDNVSYDIRQTINYKAKKTIAKFVARRIPNGSSLYISIGTTPEMVARELTLHRDLTVYTNNINVALTLCENSSCSIVIFGGKIRNKHRDILDMNVEKFFSSQRADFGIFGVGGIGKDGSLFDFTKEEIGARKSICLHSEKKFLIADYSKFHRTAFVKGGKIYDVDTFFSDLKPPKDICKLLHEKNIEFIYDKKEM